MSGRAKRAAGGHGEGDKTEGRSSLWTVLLLVEFLALLIGLAMPITPSKTGSDFSLADWFFDDPTYLQEVLVYFILTNLVIGVLALIALVMIKLEKRRGGAES